MSVFIVNPRHPEYTEMVSDIIDRGDKLWLKLTRLDEKYYGVVWFDGSFSWSLYIGSSKKDVLRIIDDNLLIIKERCAFFALPDFHLNNVSIPKGLSRKKITEIAIRQKHIMENNPDEPYAQISVRACRAYGLLEEKFRKLRDDTIVVPAKAFHQIM